MWLETVLLIEAAAAFWLSGLNLTLLARVVAAEGRRPRRIAACVLGSVCAAGALESLWFLWARGEAETGAWHGAALLLVRTGIVASTGLLSLLLLRGLARR